MKISDLLRRIGLLIFILALINGAVMFFFINNTVNDARVVNYTGVVRGLTQRVLKLDYAGQYSQAAPYAVKLDGIINGLQNGDESLGLVRLNDEIYQSLMSNVAADWQKLKFKIEETKARPEANAELLEMSEDYFGLTDRAVSAAEAAARNKVIIAEIVQLILVFFSFILIFFLRSVTIQKVFRPLSIIMSILPKAASGDLSQRLPMRGKDEFGQIASVFNRLIEGQEALTKTLDQKVREKTKELEINIKELVKSKNKVEEEKIHVEQLLSENEKFKLAVEGASDHVVISDGEGIILYGNAAAEKITGFTVKEMIGKKAGQQWGGLMDKPFYEHLWHTIKTEAKPFKGKVQNKRKNGEIYDALVSISPILGKDGKPMYFVGIERDITQEVAVDKAKTEFVSVASHQLRTPLTAINWYAEILLSGDAGKINKKQKDYLNEIYQGNKRMVSLVNNLLSVSRLELGTFPIFPEEADFCKIIESLIKEMKPLAAKKKINISLACPTKIAKLMLDVNLTRFIFQNLVSNSIKYTPEKGEVKVEIKTTSSNILVSVSDNGLGIPLGEQRNIFGKFYRAKNVQKSETTGTGLGLYIVKSVIDFVGGKISFESKENKGTTFFVEIPLSGMKPKMPKPKNIN